MARPFYIFDNWSAYDELSDNVRLTEDLSMRQFDEVVRLRRSGVQIDAYLMDAFWYEPEDEYLKWRKDRWPNGPDRWLEACRQEGILPGLWFPANTAFMLDPPEAWKSSLAANKYGFCCYAGGFLKGFLEVLSHWYWRGVRVFKFDFAELAAVPSGSADTESAREKNANALRNGFASFRRNHPEAKLLAYNGFEDTEYMPWTDRPVRPVFDRQWLSVFDTVYCGDPRPAGIPLPNFWRSVDIYADAQVHLLHKGGLDLSEIDNCAFMIGNCGTCYRRGNAEWRTTALLSLARGGRVHMTLGNMEALTDEDGRWLASVQRLYEDAGKPLWVGGNPGQGEIYGYATDTVATVVNPSLQLQSLDVGAGFDIVYADGPADLAQESVRLGAGSVAVLGRNVKFFGNTPAKYGELREVPCEWRYTSRTAEAEIPAPNGRPIHVVFRQFSADDLLVNTSGGSPPNGISMSSLLRISATCDESALSVTRPDDKVAWSGLAWAYGIIASKANKPVRVKFETDDPAVASVSGVAYYEFTE